MNPIPLLAVALLTLVGGVILWAFDQFDAWVRRWAAGTRRPMPLPMVVAISAWCVLLAMLGVLVLASLVGVSDGETASRVVLVSHSEDVGGTS